jgi:hypothetical protein
MSQDEVLRVLSRIARTGKPADRLRAVELLGRQMGMFRENGSDDRVAPRDSEGTVERLRQLILRRVAAANGEVSPAQLTVVANGGGGDAS